MGACICKAGKESTYIEVDRIKSEANVVNENKSINESSIKNSNIESKVNLGLQPHQGVNLSKRNRR